MITGMISSMELLLVIVVALVVFGGSRLAGVGKSLGQSVREFKEEVSQDGKDEGTEESKGPDHKDESK
ncbi:twin-arginine translocase TatA/TatE family subunit [Peptococcus simiae]|uniref:twin-arginine translocase TatA/TatE family subunit n=1 Tax=Peptococcus simiae TaxID=1643805 RepID=UPI003980E4C4